MYVQVLCLIYRYGCVQLFGTISGMYIHMQTDCRFHLGISCPNASHGCQEVFQSWSDLDNHLRICEYKQRK